MTRIKLSLGLWLMLACSVCSSITSAQQLDPQQIQLIKDTAASICDTVKEAKGKMSNVQLQGEINAKLGGLIGKVVDVGGSGKGSLTSTSEEFEGLSRDATAAALESTRGCRERVFDKMFEKLTNREPQIKLYRRLDYYVEQLDFQTKMLSHREYKDDAELWVLIRRVRNATEPVCQARAQVSEFGDTAILEDLNRLCNVLELSQDFDESTAGASAWIMAKFPEQFGVIVRLRDNLKRKLNP